jgi:hypothetical protein
MNQIIIIFIILLFLLLCKYKKENFIFKHIPIENNRESCKMRCDNTIGCEKYFFDNVTGQCLQMQYYKHGDIFHPYTTYDYLSLPHKYKHNYKYRKYGRF